MARRTVSGTLSSDTGAAQKAVLLSFGTGGTLLQMQKLTRAELKRLLGLKPPAAPEWKVVAQSVNDGLEFRHYLLGSSLIPALFIAPAHARHALPAVLYCHAHGNNYQIGKTEMLNGRPALHDPPLALELAKAGAMVFCADMPGFGERQTEGSETALAKSALWKGQSLIGQMIQDQFLALDVLIAHCQPTRIAAAGISMGGTLAYLTAALRKEITAVAHLCVFSDMAPLIETGAHDLHGPYMTIPALLPAYDMSAIASLISPRYQLVATGGADPLTPDSAYKPAIERLLRAYFDHPSNLTIIRDQNSGHKETKMMREAVLSFLNENLNLVRRSIQAGRAE